MSDTSAGRTCAVTVDELLAHARWVRELARALARDPDAADDLAQSAFAIALARRRTRPLNLRAWLAAVLRNLAREGGRRDAQRRTVERDGARAESLPGADELVARAESERRVAAAVLALGEPYRGALLLHYYEGVPVAEIARRSGEPTATVASRLQRARAQLRVRLDETADREDVDARGWIAAVAPFLDRAPAASALPLAPLLGGLVAAAGLVCLAWFVLGRAERGVADAESAQAALVRADGVNAPDASASTPDATAALVREPVAVSEVAVHPVSAAADSASSASAPPAAPAAGELGRIHGRVLRSDGAPAVARRVRFVELTRGTERYVVTDADGRFDERELRAGSWNLATWAEARELAALGRANEGTTGFTDLAQRTVDLAAGADVEVVFGAQSPAAVCVRGRVLLLGESVDALLQWLPDGPGAMDRQKLVRAKADGGYEARLDVPGRHWIVATVTGHAGRAEFVVDVPHAREHTHDLVLPDARLAGQVTGPGGEPVASARVQLVPRGGLRPRHLAASFEFDRKSDADGRFDFELLLPGSYELTVHGGSYGAEFAAAASVPLELAIAESVPAADIEIRVARGASVRGRIADTGSRAKYARVFVFESGGAALNPIRGADVDDTLRFELPALAPGRYSVVAAGGALWSAPLAFEVPRAEGDAELELRLAPGARLEVAVDARTPRTIAVRDERGRDFASLLDPQSFGRDLRGEWSAARYAFFVPPGNYTVTARGTSGEMALHGTESLLAGETRTLELVR